MGKVTIVREGNISQAGPAVLSLLFSNQCWGGIKAAFRKKISSVYNMSIILVQWLMI